MTAVALALVSALLFGGMSVALRIGLHRREDPALATITCVGVAAAIVLLWATAEVPARGVHVGGAWPFALAGLLSPGAAQLFVVLAVREAGSSRTSMVFGAAPLATVTIALVFLGEPLRAPLVIGAMLVVGGGVELARERGRPEHLRGIGLAYALVGVLLFSIRDNLVRWLAGDTRVPPGVAGAAALLGGLALIAVAVGPRLGGTRVRHAFPFVPAGVCFGLSYVALFEAYFRGRVTVVSPLVATESLWGVVLSLLLLRSTELVGRRLVLGAALIVAGGALIGAFR